MVNPSSFRALIGATPAMVRNREMGLIITSTEVATVCCFLVCRLNRLDNVTDTDNDGMPDIFEVNNGLNRTISMHGGVLEADIWTTIGWTVQS